MARTLTVSSTISIKTVSFDITTASPFTASGGLDRVLTTPSTYLIVCDSVAAAALSTPLGCSVLIALAMAVPVPFKAS